MTGRFVGKTYTEYQNEFVEHFPYGKQIGEFVDPENKQKRPQAPNPILLGLESEKSENQVPNLENLKNMLNLLMKIPGRMGQTLFQTSS